MTDVEEIGKDKLVTRKFRSYEGLQFVNSENLERSIVEVVRDIIEHSMFFKPSLLETARENDPFHEPWSYGVNPFKQACKEDFLRFGYLEDKKRIVVSIRAASRSRTRMGSPGRQVLSMRHSWSAESHTK